MFLPLDWDHFGSTDTTNICWDVIQCQKFEGAFRLHKANDFSQNFPGTPVVSVVFLQTPLVFLSSLHEVPSYSLRLSANFLLSPSYPAVGTVFYYCQGTRIKIRQRHCRNYRLQTKPPTPLHTLSLRAFQLWKITQSLKVGPGINPKILHTGAESLQHRVLLDFILSYTLADTL